jgi:hypothetical protein
VKGLALSKKGICCGGAVLLLIIIIAMIGSQQPSIQQQEQPSNGQHSAPQSTSPATNSPAVSATNSELPKGTYIQSCTQCNVNFNPDASQSLVCFCNTFLVSEGGHTTSWKWVTFLLPCNDKAGISNCKGKLICGLCPSQSTSSSKTSGQYSCNGNNCDWHSQVSNAIAGGGGAPPVYEAPD